MIIGTGEKLYGRRKCRKLTKIQEELFGTLLEDISITSFPKEFLQRYYKVFLEVGFGMGDHIAQLAVTNPDSLFIGCESFINGIASLLVKINNLKIDNIFIFHGDARVLLNEAPSCSLDGIFLLFPDPWPKRKHIYRRFLQEHTIETIYEKLKIGGACRIATDHETYRQWMVKLFESQKFANIFKAQFFDKNSRPDEVFWPKTKYEKMATNDIVFAIYKKV